MAAQCELLWGLNPPSAPGTPLLEMFDALRWLGHVARMHRDMLPRILLKAWVYMPKGIKTEFKLGPPATPWPGGHLRVHVRQGAKHMSAASVLRACEKVPELPGDADWEERMAAVEMLNELRQ